MHTRAVHAHAYIHHAHAATTTVLTSAIVYWSYSLHQFLITIVRAIFRIVTC